MKLNIMTLVLLAGFGLRAQDVPLPAALTTAKNAIVVNDGVDQDVFERLVLELKAWKRFDLVNDAAQADVTISIDSERAVATNWATGHAYSAPVYHVSFKRGDTVLYRDQLKGCCSIKAMTRKTLEKLDKRMREQEKARKQ